MATEQEQEQGLLVPAIPVLTEYEEVKKEILTRVEKFKDTKIVTEETKKEVKKEIAEINKIKQKISRFRIDNTALFLKYIEPYVSKCQELEKLCTDSVADINAKVKELEDKERADKKESIKKLFDFLWERTKYNTLLNFEMFFEPAMTNKTQSLTVLEKQMGEWLQKRVQDIEFFYNSADEPDVVIPIYLKNGFDVTAALAEYQERFKTAAEIKAIQATEEASKPTYNGFEKTVSVIIKIENLPLRKASALQNFLEGLGIEYEFSKMEK